MVCSVASQRELRRQPRRGCTEKSLRWVRRNPCARPLLVFGDRRGKRGQENHHHHPSQACRGLRRKRSHPKSSSHYVFSLRQNPAQPWGNHAALELFEAPNSSRFENKRPTLACLKKQHVLQKSHSLAGFCVRRNLPGFLLCQGGPKRARNLSEDEAELPRPGYTRVLNQPQQNARQESAPKRENRDQRNIRAWGHRPVGTLHLETQPGHHNPVLQHTQTHTASSPPAPAAPGAVQGQTRAF